MVKKLKIFLDTVMPPKGEYYEFSRSMLYTPIIEKNNSESKEVETKEISIENRTDLAKEVCYSDDKYYPKLSREKMLQFLFNEKEFEKVMGTTSSTLSPEERTEIQKNNIIATLKSLFPVGYPTINNVDDSYSILNGKSERNTLWFNPFKDYRSYLKINSSVYTVERVIWLNDKYNFETARSQYKNMKLKSPLAPLEKDYYSGSEEGDTLSIIVMIDLMKGELNAKNMKDIKCSFTSEMLGIMLDDYLNSNKYHEYDVRRNRLLYDIALKKGIQGAKTTVETVVAKDSDKKYIEEIEKWINEPDDSDVKKTRKTAYENLKKIFDRIGRNDYFKNKIKSISSYSPQKSIRDILIEVGNASSSNMDLFYYLNFVNSNTIRDKDDIVNIETLAKDILAPTKRNLKSEAKQVYFIILYLMKAIEDEDGSKVDIKFSGGSLKTTKYNKKINNKKHRHKKTRKI
jgi:hypothetical protein